MIELISVEEARQHVRVATTAFDADIQFKILQATAILLNYLKVPSEASVDDSPLILPWTSVEPPWDIKAAALLIFGDLWQYREGSQISAFREFDPLSPAARSLLHRYRDPAMA
jgi:hypothetical protein